MDEVDVVVAVVAASALTADPLPALRELFFPDQSQQSGHRS